MPENQLSRARDNRGSAPQWPSAPRNRVGRGAGIVGCDRSFVAGPRGGENDARLQKLISRGLDWVASTQSRMGSWNANDSRYPTAMTALAGVALLQEGSTTTQGKYSKNIRLTVDYLLSHSRPNGLIGDQFKDDRYTYGHGYSMLFLSQVMGEEDDLSRRKELADALDAGRGVFGQSANLSRRVGVCQRQGLLARGR